jgi:hypothetical protein
MLPVFLRPFFYSLFITFQMNQVPAEEKLIKELKTEDQVAKTELAA